MASFNRWVGQVAVVTGAVSCTGASIAKRLVEEGLQVVGLALREDLLNDLAKTHSDKNGKFYPIKTNISKDEEVLSAFKWIADNLGPVHILINNVSVFKTDFGLIDGETDNWWNIINASVLGLCIATREAVKCMKANNIDGHIIHINSIMGHKVPNAKNLNVIPASKYAITALTETLRIELLSSKSKIKISSISPGTLKTAMDTDDSPEQMSMLKPEDVAESVVYVLGTPPHVQVHELMIRAIGDEI